jgi:hypothetical protein
VQPVLKVQQDHKVLKVQQEIQDLLALQAQQALKVL